MLKQIIAIVLLFWVTGCNHQQNSANSYYDVRGISYKVYCPKETLEARHKFANFCVDRNEAEDCKEMMQQIYCYKVPTINTGSWDSEIPCPEAVLENHKNECLKAGWKRATFAQGINVESPSLGWASINNQLGWNDR